MTTELPDPRPPTAIDTATDLIEAAYLTSQRMGPEVLRAWAVIGQLTFARQMLLPTAYPADSWMTRHVFEQAAHRTEAVLWHWHRRGIAECPWISYVEEAEQLRTPLRATIDSILLAERGARADAGIPTDLGGHDTPDQHPGG